MRLNDEGRGFYCGHEFVNLQLGGEAKNLLFATCNLGAEKETDCGEHYQFGCTEPYLKTYKDFDAKNAPFDDVCKLKMGGLWRIPTMEELQALIEQTQFSCVKINGVRGAKLSKTVDGKERYVFFPSAGLYNIDWLSYKGSIGYVWSTTPYNSTYAYGLTFYSGFKEISFHYCNYGLSVRGVFNII